KGSLKGKQKGSKLEWMITASDSSRLILPYYPEMFNESAIKFYSQKEGRKNILKSYISPI
ncbi:MAG: hypothetical protein ACRC8Y_27460, partial [Chroococcales cyanobacterium]